MLLLLIVLIIVLTFAFNVLPAADATVPFGNILTVADNVNENNTIGDNSNSGTVSNDSDVLPQTGGISPATMIGLLGLALIASGGTILTILKKKGHGKN